MAWNWLLSCGGRLFTFTRFFVFPHICQNIFFHLGRAAGLLNACFEIFSESHPTAPLFILPTPTALRALTHVISLSFTTLHPAFGPFLSFLHKIGLQPF